MATDDPEPVPDLVLGVTLRWCEAVIAGEVAVVWFLMDSNLRLALVQRWLVGHEDRADLRQHEPLETFAHELIDDRPRSGETASLWSEVIGDIARAVSTMVPSFPRERWGWSTHRRLAGDQLEVVLLLDVEEVPEIPTGVALFGPDVCQTFLLRNDGVAQPEIAGFAYAAPTPGWPPTIPTEI